MIAAMMIREHAEQIAQLLNRRNQLAGHYTADRVLRESNYYLYRLSEDRVSGFVELKPVQWYQAEILHLTTDEAHEGRGIAKALLLEAVDRAIAAGNRIAQCTIRDGNERSEALFNGQRFSKVGRFANPETGNVVGVWQRILTPVSGETGM